MKNFLFILLFTIAGFAGLGIGEKIYANCYVCTDNFGVDFCSASSVSINCIFLGLAACNSPAPACLF